MGIGPDGETVILGGVDYGTGVVPSGQLAQTAAAPGGPVFLAHNSAVGSAGADPTVAPIDTATLNTPGWVLAEGSIFLPVGSWLVQADVTLEGTTNNRTSFDSWIEFDGAQVAGTVGQLYLRLSNYGASASMSAALVVPVLASVEVRVVVDRTNGNTTGRFVAGGSRLAVHRVSG